jgi:cytidylate kinase
MIIIIEGVDLTFKSTLAELLSRELGLPVEQGSSFQIAKLPESEFFEFYKKSLGGEDKILDRSMYSNRVYAQAYSGFNLLSRDEVSELEDIVRDNHEQCLVIFCTATIDELVRRYKLRGDDEVKVEALEGLLERFYDVIHSECKLPLLQYDTVYRTPAEMAAYVKDIIKKGVRLPNGISETD